MKSDPGYYPLFEKIGEVSSLWATVEADLRGFVFDLSCWHDGRFLDSEASADQAGAFVCLITAFGHMDSRALVATAKVLAHWVSEPEGFYERSEPILSLFDNDLRNRRNRYIHDNWILWGDKIKRFRSGSIIRREKGSGKRKFDFSPTEEFSSLEEIGDLASEIRRALLALDELAQEIRDAAYEKWQPQESGEQ